eukprot:XP_014012356.1 PREDICTED: high mobility group protein B2-like [Salmo salar]
MVKGDINKPKGKTSAYAFFVQTCREEQKIKHPDQSVNFAEFSKQCSERWRASTATDKRRFEDMAKNDKVRYERDMRGYVPPKGMAKSGRKKKDPNAPKRPPSAFFVFSAEFRPTVKQEFPGCSIGECAKKLGIMWGQQTPTQKQPFEEKALRLREKYDKVLPLILTTASHSLFLHICPQDK